MASRSWKKKFLQKLRQTANVRLACEAAGVDRSTPYHARDKDEKFAGQWDDALEDACDQLESEARRRAVEGVDEPVFYQGEICGYIKRLSDSLLMFLLRAHRPEKYRERYEVKNTGISKIEVVYVDQPMGGEGE